MILFINWRNIQSRNIQSKWACSITAAEDLLGRSEGKQKTYKSSGQKQKYILSLTLTWVLPKSMCFHTATYRSFLSFCDRDGRQRSILSGPYWQIEWREWNLLFLEGLPCGNRVHPFSSATAGIFTQKNIVSRNHSMIEKDISINTP